MTRLLERFIPFRAVVSSGPIRSSLFPRKLGVRATPLGIGIGLAVCWFSGLWAFAQAEVDFNKVIRPILADKCFACHGPDEGTREADLRLDLKSGAFADLGGYVAVEPGNVEGSRLASRIQDADDPMPPADHAKQLKESEKQALLAWIAAGAPWQEHWAYTPLPEAKEEAKNATPVPTQANWSRNFIDDFILHRLEQNGVAPSPPASHTVLTRRLFFDLTGLPPEPQDLDALDGTEGSYVALVDQLLSSPHFGERMAMYWLDLVRYADTVGYHGDQDVSVSPFRDYVIQSFNGNKPFDQFTREQLAGDLMPAPTQEHLVASGYNKLGMMSAEGGVQPEEYLAKYAADRVRNASTVWLGSTLGCAECHDHKFDPFTTKDFYRFASFFADIKERGLYSGANRDGNWGPSIKVEDPGLAKLREPLDERIRQLEARISTRTPALDAAQQEWESQVADYLRAWKLQQIDSASADGNTKLKVHEDGSVLANGASPATNTYILQLDVREPIKSFQIEVLPDESLPKSGPGRAGNGNFVISEVRLRRLADPQDTARKTSYRFSHALATWEQADGQSNPYGKWAAQAAIDNDVHGETWGWAILPKVGTAQALYVELEQEIDSERFGTFELVIEQKHANPKHTLGKFRLFVSEQGLTDEASTLALGLPPEVKDALRAKLRTEQEQEQVREHFIQTTPILAGVRKQLAQARADLDALIQSHTRSTLITQAVEPREMRVLPRGNWMDLSGEVVLPGVPHFMTQIEKEGRADRRDLAEWIVDPQNPLTARVFVNRLWKQFFGTGLSKVLDDVGAQGELPSHPELLDRLAEEFVDSGWDVKHIVRRIVLSSTYRQSSFPTATGIARDPYNRELARQSRFRLDAELIRDNALAVSGLLDRRIGGRSVKPYQPEGLYRHLNFPARKYQADSGPDQYRRGVYTHWQRQFLHPAMQNFDAPAREECTAERPRSNTPLAALVLLNDPSYVEAARVLATNIIGQHDRDTDRIEAMMLKALSRKPTAKELAVLQTLRNEEEQFYLEFPAKAVELLDVGDSDPPQDIAATELATWTAVARAIFNLHEMITRN